MPNKEKHYYVYILTNRPYGVLYIGVTNNIYRRLNEHREKYNNGFTNKYLTHRLVYYEIYGEIGMAI